MFTRFVLPEKPAKREFGTAVAAAKERDIDRDFHTPRRECERRAVQMRPAGAQLNRNGDCVAFKRFWLREKANIQIKMLHFLPGRAIRRAA